MTSGVCVGILALYLVGATTVPAVPRKPMVKPLIIKVLPVVPPKRHRLKENIEPFRRFEFDQRAIV